MKNALEASGIAYEGKFEGGFRFQDQRKTALKFAKKAGVDKNVRMVMFGHTNANDMDFSYDQVSESALLTAHYHIEANMKNADHPVDQGQKNGSQEESQNRLSY